MVSCYSLSKCNSVVQFLYVFGSGVGTASFGLGEKMAPIICVWFFQLGEGSQISLSSIWSFRLIVLGVADMTCLMVLFLVLGQLRLPLFTMEETLANEEEPWDLTMASQKFYRDGQVEPDCQLSSQRKVPLLPFPTTYFDKRIPQFPLSKHLPYGRWGNLRFIHVPQVFIFYL